MYESPQSGRGFFFIVYFKTLILWEKQHTLQKKA